MGFKETAPSNSIFSESRVCCSNKCCMSSCLDEKSLKRLVTEPSRTDNNLLQQQFSHSIIKESCVQKRTKHIDTRFHFIRELVNNKEICLEFCRYEEQLADIFTKPLAKDTFEYLHSYIGMTSSS